MSISARAWSSRPLPTPPASTKSSRACVRMSVPTAGWVRARGRVRAARLPQRRLRHHAPARQAEPTSRRRRAPGSAAATSAQSSATTRRRGLAPASRSNLVLVFERQRYPRAVGHDLAAVDLHVQLHDVRNAQVAQRTGGGGHGALDGVFPRYRAGADNFSDAIYAFACLTLLALRFC